MFELPGSSVAAMVADAAGGAHLALGNAAGAALANVHQSLAAEASVHRTLASQLGSLCAFSDTAAMLAASMDQSAALRANFASNALAMGAAPFPRSAFGGAVTTDLYGPPAALATNILDTFSAKPAIQGLLPGLGLAETMTGTVASLLRQMASPLHEAAQRLLDVQRSAWRFDASRLWAPYTTGLAERLQDALFPAGTLWGELHVLLFATADPTGLDPARVEEAVHAVVEEIPWRAHNPRVWQAILGRAEEEGMTARAVKRRELRAAVFLALATRDAPQTVRLGAEWVIGDDGRKAAMPPHELPMHLFWQWLCAKAIAIAEAALLERPYPAGEDVLDRPPRTGQPGSVVSLDAGWDRPGVGPALDLLLVDADDPLTVLIARHDRDEDAALVRAVLAVASPRQRELAVLLAAGLSEAEAARTLGIEPTTARAQLHRLRRKAV